MFPKVVLYHQYMAPRSLDVPAGLSEDELVRRTINTVERRGVVGYIVWDTTRMTRLTPAGARSEEVPTAIMLNARPLGQSVPPVLHPGDPGYTPPPLHQQARKWLIGQWGIAYPDQIGGWTPPEDSTMELRADGSFAWRSPLPWFTDGPGWFVTQNRQALELSLSTRYHWADVHRLVRIEVQDGCRAWIWRTDDQRDVLLAIAIA